MLHSPTRLSRLSNPPCLSGNPPAGDAHFNQILETLGACSFQLWENQQDKEIASFRMTASLIILFILTPYLRVTNVLFYLTLMLLLPLKRLLTFPYLISVELIGSLMLAVYAVMIDKNFLLSHDTNEYFSLLLYALSSIVCSHTPSRWLSQQAC